MAQAAIPVSTDQSVFDFTDVTTSGNISTDPVSFWEFEPLDWSWYTCLLFITAALGILGNSLVLVVTSSPRDAMRNPDLLIRALAIADLVTSVLIIPLPKAQVLPQNTAAQVYCKTVFSKLLIWISIIASIFTLTVLSVDRCVAIVHPFFYRRAVTRYRVKIVVVFVWIIALLINTDLLFVRYVDDDNECVFSFSSHLSEDIYGGLRFWWVSLASRHHVAHPRGHCARFERRIGALSRADSTRCEINHGEKAQRYFASDCRSYVHYMLGTKPIRIFVIQFSVFLMNFTFQAFFTRLPLFWHFVILAQTRWSIPCVSRCSEPLLRTCFANVVHHQPGTTWEEVFSHQT